MQNSQGTVRSTAKLQKANHCRNSTIGSGQIRTTSLGRGSVTMIGGNMTLRELISSGHRQPPAIHQVRENVKAVPTTTHRTLMDQCSDFLEYLEQAV